MSDVAVRRSNVAFYLVVTYARIQVCGYHSCLCPFV